MLSNTWPQQSREPRFSAYWTGMRSAICCTVSMPEVDRREELLPQSESAYPESRFEFSAPRWYVILKLGLLSRYSMRWCSAAHCSARSTEASQLRDFVWDVNWSFATKDWQYFCVCWSGNSGTSSYFKLTLQHFLDVLLVIREDLLNVTVKVQLDSLSTLFNFHSQECLLKSLEYLSINSFLTSSHEKRCIMSMMSWTNRLWQHWLEWYIQIPWSSWR